MSVATLGEGAMYPAAPLPQGIYRMQSFTGVGIIGLPEISRKGDVSMEVSFMAEAPPRRTITWLDVSSAGFGAANGACVRFVDVSYPVGISCLSSFALYL